MEPLRRVLRPVKRWLKESMLPRVNRVNNQYDRNTYEIIETLPDDAVCIDIGASNGSVLKRMIASVPNGKYYAFEARPDAAEALRENFQQAIIHSLALSDEKGTTTFHVAVDDPGYSGIRRQEYPGDFQVDEIEVPLDTLDNVIPQDEPVKFIKLDVEGAEYKVLSGASQLLKRTKPLLVFEYGRAGRDNYGTSPKQIFDLFESCGMEISLLSDWLKGRGSMNLQKFEKACNSHWYFVAHSAGQAC